MVESAPVLPPKERKFPKEGKRKPPKKENTAKPEDGEDRHPRVELAKELYKAVKETPDPDEIPEPPLWRDKAEFLPSTASFLANCGINPNEVNPLPIGQGFTHIVFSYHPEGEKQKVVKMPRSVSVGFMSTGYHEDLQNISFVRKYFGDYAVNTEVHRDNASGRYVYVQDAVKGNPVTSLTESQEIRTQIADLARLNRELMRQKNVSMDFLGVPGFLSLLKHQFWSIVSKKSHFDLSNILVDEKGKLKLIDVGLIRFGKGLPPKQQAVSMLGFNVNRIIMRLYFGVDIKP